MSLYHPLAIFLWLALTLQSGAAQTGTAGDDAKPNSPNRWTVSLTLIADAGRDRFGNLTVQRGNWLAQNINWTSPNGQSALSALLAGRHFKISRWADAVVLAGPWYSYDQHSWNEMVLATHFAFHGERLRIASANYWGSPLRSSGYFYDSHTQTIAGLPHLPTWLGASSLEERTSSGLVRLFLGPMLTRKKAPLSVSAFPYWDVQRRTFDMRIGMSYRHEARRFSRE